MGYAVMLGECWVCKQMFSFNPHKVPSFRDQDGIRQPVCFNCVTWANKKREELGHPPLKIHPEAYESIREEEL